MAGFTFEGEIEDLTSSQLELISKVLQEKGVTDHNVRIGRLGKPGDNYAANVKHITAVLDNGETFRMIAKVAPTHEMIRTQMGSEVIFANECLMYNEVLPKFHDLQLAAGISQEDVFRFPKCYGTLLEPMSEIILLEDLKDLKFEMLDRFKSLTNEVVKLILKNFAALHSLSFALRKQDPEKFELYSGQFQDYFTMMSANQDFQDGMASLEEDFITVLESDKYKRAIRGSISKLTDHSSKVFKYASNSRYSVIIHGDGWTNNIMFRLENEVPVEAILIDYQMSKLSNPACDLLYMIFSCTDYATRHQHYYDWIDYYYSEFDKSLDNYGLKANDEFPREQLDAGLRRYSKFYFSMAILVSSVLLKTTEDAAKLMEAIENNVEMKDLTAAMKSSNLNPEYVTLFKRKIEDLVDSYKEFGYLDLLCYLD